MLHTKTLTEKIIIAPVVKVIGNKQYVVESFFNENANLDLTDKVKKLIENDVKRRTNTLLSAETELTSHNPTESSGYKEVEEKK